MNNVFPWFAVLFSSKINTCKIMFWVKAIRNLTFGTILFQKGNLFPELLRDDQSCMKMHCHYNVYFVRPTNKNKSFHVRFLSTFLSLFLTGTQNTNYLWEAKYSNRELKHRRFWATAVNRKFMFLLLAYLNAQPVSYESSHSSIYNLTFSMKREKCVSKRRSFDFRLTSVAQKRLCLSSLIFPCDAWALARTLARVITRGFAG